MILTVSRSSVCAGQSVTLSWQASDSASTVAIVGVGSSLPSSGSKSIEVSAPMTFFGYARNACGSGTDAFADVKTHQSGTAALGAGSTSLQQGQTTTIAVSVDGVSSWSLSSSLGNGLSPSFGTSSQSVTYTATRTGPDTVTLITSGGCEPLQRTITIVVVTTPPSSGTLRCCDGTFSPTCKDCAKKQGCCSSHGGVCGC